MRTALREKANPAADKTQAAIMSGSSECSGSRNPELAACQYTRGSGQLGGNHVDDRRYKCPSSGMIMDQAEQLSSLIGEIYDAALDPSLWSDIVGKAGRFVGGSAASIYSKSPTAMTVTVHYQSGLTRIIYKSISTNM